MNSQIEDFQNTILVDNSSNSVSPPRLYCLQMLRTWNSKGRTTSSTSQVSGCVSPVWYKGRTSTIHSPSPPHHTRRTWAFTSGLLDRGRTTSAGPTTPMWLRSTPGQRFVPIYTFSYDTFSYHAYET